MLDYLHDNSLITRHQHGFLSRRSTVSNLLKCVNDWILKLINTLLWWLTLTMQKHLML